MIRITLPDGTVVHKIGMTNTNRSTDRMMEILRSWFTKYRFVPHSELKLDMECQDPYKLEAYIHKILKANRFEPVHKVDGGTEMFVDLNELRVIQFLRSYNNSQYTTPPELSDEAINVINRLLVGGSNDE